nr:putative ribonuclease H-like domain-containing protein [Tanacetum cinerariifolium]
MVNVAAARENVGSKYDWLADTDKKVDEQELEAHYSYMAKIQEVPTADSGTDSEPVEQETDDSNVILDSLDMCKDDIQNEQNDVDSDDERVALANLIVNLKLDIDENKKIQKQLKKANTTLAQKLKECKTILLETSKSLGSLLVSEIVAWLHFRPSRLSLRSIRHLMTVPLTMTNLNTKSVPKANVSEGLSKPVTAQTLPQTAKKAFAPILGYGDLVQRNVMINRVYYIEGLNHNLFSVGQFCDADLEVGFMKLSHLNFDYINLLSKKDIVIGLPKLKGTEFLNKTLNAFFKEKGIEHQTFTARTPEQNDFVKRRNRTLVEADQTMLSALQLPLFFWAEAIKLNTWRYLRAVLKSCGLGHNFKIMASTTTKYHCTMTLSQPYQSHATPYSTPVPSTSILSITS